MRIEPAGQTANTKPDTSDAKRLKDACRDFEAMLVNQMLKEMRKTVVKTDLFGSEKDEQYFREMMDFEVSKSISRTGSLGIAEMLYSQLSKLQTRGENR